MGHKQKLWREELYEKLKEYPGPIRQKDIRKTLGCGMSIDYAMKKLMEEHDDIIKFSYGRDVQYRVIRKEKSEMSLINNAEPVAERAASFAEMTEAILMHSERSIAILGKIFEVLNGSGGNPQPKGPKNTKCLREDLLAINDNLCVLLNGLETLYGQIGGTND